MSAPRGRSLRAPLLQSPRLSPQYTPTPQLSAPGVHSTLFPGDLRQLSLPSQAEIRFCPAARRPTSLPPAAPSARRSVRASRQAAARFRRGRLRPSALARTFWAESLRGRGLVGAGVHKCNAPGLPMRGGQRALLPRLAGGALLPRAQTTRAGPLGTLGLQGSRYQGSSWTRRGPGPNLEGGATARGRDQTWG